MKTKLIIAFFLTCFTVPGATQAQIVANPHESILPNTVLVPSPQSRGWPGAPVAAPALRGALTSLPTLNPRADLFQALRQHQRPEGNWVALAVQARTNCDRS